MEDYKRQCIEFMAACGALRLGRFVTKSGRVSPYFIDSGRFDSGRRIARVGEFFADALAGREGDFDLIYGPAYKGIPLAVAVSIALARRGLNVPFVFNRKEAKDHGEGGGLVGRIPCPGERVLIVEDVTTAGTSVRETAALLAAASPGAILAGLAVLVDRQERGPGGRGALEELGEEFGLHAIAIVNLDEIVAHLHNRPLDGKVHLDDEMLERIREYRKQYGA